jgi:hypothetical protein|tara:strand:- start:22 stop:276 length:255 start_codon:yes stop_codon:yes gene_type:complete
MKFEDYKDWVIKDSVTVEGITQEYVWYHAKLLSAKMSQWDNDFQKLVKVMEDRHQEHLRMLEDALQENRILRIRLKEKTDGKAE